MLRRTAIRIAAALAVLLILGSCARTGADEQTRSAGQVGYPEVPRNLTRVAPDQRKELPTVSGPCSRQQPDHFDSGLSRQGRCDQCLGFLVSAMSQGGT